MTDTAWNPNMDEAPRDGRMLMLVVEFEENPIEDSNEPQVTIGYNELEDTGHDKWHIAGWDWSHDQFTAGRGKPIKWAAYPSPHHR